ncbi:MAG: class I SAM-dependent methyltransferase [Pseudohongiella sp.]|nr:class I SAM-dependent methyltransferase [Pseudohongiella sp.]
MKNLLVVLMAVLAFGSVSVQAQGLDIAGLTAKITNDSSRADADKARDAGRKPIQVLDFLGVRPGMTVIDLVAAAGYYTEVLSNVVGPRGKVYMQNSSAALTGPRGPRTVEAIEQRLANNRLSNVERLTADINALGLPDNSLDAAVIALEFHELYLSDNPNAVAEFLAEMSRVLKHGAVLGVIEHAGFPVFDPKPLHRALEANVVADAAAAGFFAEASGKMLRNIDDPKNVGVFDPSVRGNTDRFVLRLVNKR